MKKTKETPIWLEAIKVFTLCSIIAVISYLSCAYIIGMEIKTPLVLSWIALPFVGVGFWGLFKQLYDF